MQNKVREPRWCTEGGPLLWARLGCHMGWLQLSHGGSAVAVKNVNHMELSIKDLCRSTRRAVHSSLAGDVSYRHHVVVLLEPSDPRSGPCQTPVQLELSVMHPYCRLHLQLSHLSSFP